MIKINLARRKQSETVQKTGFLAVNKLKNVNLEEVRELPLKKVVATIVICVLASQLTKFLQTKDLEQADEEVRLIKEDVERIQRSMKKYANYEAVQKDVETNIKSISLKLEVIKHLLADRDSAFKLLLLFAKAIPRDLWITTLRVEADSVAFSGASLNFNDLPEFIKRLEESNILTDVELTSSKQEPGPQGREITRFDIRSRRKRS